MRIVGRTHHMLVSVYGRHWRKPDLAFFTAYIDDSGTDPRQQVANATMLIVPATRIIALESEWNKLREKEHFSCWHTSVAVARNAKSEFAHWDDIKFDRVFTRVRAICKKYCVQPMSFSVHKRDYDEVVLARLPDADRHHYTWAIRSLLSHAEQWRLSRQIPHPLEYVFSWMGEKRHNTRRREIEDLMDQAEEENKEEGHASEFEHWSFRRSQDLPGLQCVDALAWSVYQFGLLAFCKIPLSKDAKTAWADFGTYLDGKWGFDIAVTRTNLQRWVDAEIADGRSVKKFAEWRERKRAAKERVRTVRPDDERPPATRLNGMTRRRNRGAVCIF